MPHLISHLKKKLNKIINDNHIFIKRPKFAIVISLVIVLAGAYAMTATSYRKNIQASLPLNLSFSGQYPGANAEVIIDTIAAPLEARLTVLKICYI